MKTVYLDYAATTPVDPRVVSAMLPYFSRKYGNSMSLHSFGQEAYRALEKSRQTVADFIGAHLEEIIFTSSATESNNLVMKGLASVYGRKKNHIIISKIEHDCVLESARYLKSQGFALTELSVDKEGFVNLQELERSITDATLVVSVIHGNNEIGTIQDVAAIGAVCKNHHVLFHTDASQSFGKVPIDVSSLPVDLLTASSHKIYGPKGVGMLYLRRGVIIDPLLHGGGHEWGKRSSTSNVAGIVGFAKACELCENVMKTEHKRLSALRDMLTDGILKSIKGTHLNGPRGAKRLSNNVNISFSAVEGESLVLELDFNGIAASTGSACSSKNLQPSHVLTAIGLTHVDAHGSLRMSVGRFTTKKEIEYTIRMLKQAVSKLRNISPLHYS
ncbi:MAG: cysteine desulfurase family protein [Candidatus Gottesmanbacteria bacterium]|nr:cysteine desulfurase family protein [Candidatus Gottesmanbacteria bacterium]